MKRVLLTGGSGFVGANLTRRLLTEGHEVNLLLRDMKHVKRLEGILSDVQIWNIDLNDTIAVTEAVKKIQPEWVFHLAAYGAYSWQTEIDRAVKTNLQSAMHLLDCCEFCGAEVFINTGSSSEYGWKDHAPKETEMIKPNSIYAITKAAMTHYCLWRSALYRMNISTLRLYSVYGPYEEEARLIPTVIRKGMSKTYPDFVDPDISRDFVFMEDVENAYLAVAEQSVRSAGKVYNVATGVQTSIRDVADISKKLFGITEQPEWNTMPGRNWDTNIWIGDPTLLCEELGWLPETDFASGFKKTAEWWKAVSDFEE